MTRKAYASDYHMETSIFINTQKRRSKDGLAWPYENENRVQKEGGMFFVGVTMKSCEILKN